MQIPRGIFRSLKRAVILNTLIAEMERDKFSGSCSIVHPNHAIDLVLREGRVLLASCDTLGGDAAWDSIQAMQGEEVDASLSDLSIAQIELTMEFNSGLRVLARRGKSAAKSFPPTSQHGQHSHEKRHKSPPSISVPGQGPTSGPAHAIESEKHVPPEVPSGKGEQGETVMKPHRSNSKSPELASSDEFAVFNRDLQALDSMDLKSMTEKMRANCRSMMEKLDLEHLIKNDGE